MAYSIGGAGRAPFGAMGPTQGPMGAQLPALPLPNAPGASDAERAYRAEVEKVLAGTRDEFKPDVFDTLLQFGLGALASSSQPGANIWSAIGNGGLSATQANRANRREFLQDQAVGRQDQMQRLGLMGQMAAGERPQFQSVRDVGLVQTNAPGGPKTVLPVGAPTRKVGETRVIEKGDRKITQEFDGKDWQEVATAPRWQPEKTEPDSPFSGNSMPAQVANILLKGDPSTREYAYAYSMATQPQQRIDTQTGQIVTITPQLPESIKPPTYRREAPTETPAPTSGASPAAAPGGNVTVQALDPNAKPRMTSGDRSKLNTAVSEASQMVNALREYADTVAKAGIGERVQSVAGLSTPSNQSFNMGALLAKGEQLFNLGVLNGPDLDIIRRTLPDPSTIGGQISGPGASRESVRRLINMLQDKINAAHGQWGVEAPNLVEFGERVRNGGPASTPPRPGPNLPDGFEIVR